MKLISLFLSSLIIGCCSIERMNCTKIMIIGDSLTDICSPNVSNVSCPAINLTFLSTSEILNGNFCTMNVRPNSSSLGHCNNSKNRNYIFNISNINRRYTVRMNVTAERVRMWFFSQTSKCLPSGVLTGSQNTCPTPTTTTPTSSSNDNVYCPYKGCLESCPVDPGDKCINATYDSDICNGEEENRYVLHFNGSEWTCVDCVNTSTQTTTDSPTTTITPTTQTPTDSSTTTITPTTQTPTDSSTTTITPTTQTTTDSTTSTITPTTQTSTDSTTSTITPTTQTTTDSTTSTITPTTQTSTDSTTSTITPTTQTTTDSPTTTITSTTQTTTDSPNTTITPTTQTPTDSLNTTTTSTTQTTIDSPTTTITSTTQTPTDSPNTTITPTTQTTTDSTTSTITPTTQTPTDSPNTTITSTTQTTIVSPTSTITPTTQTTTDSPNTTITPTTQTTTDSTTSTIKPTTQTPTNSPIPTITPTAQTSTDSPTSTITPTTQTPTDSSNTTITSTTQTTTDSPNTTITSTSQTPTDSPTTTITPTTQTTTDSPTTTITLTTQTTTDSPTTTITSTSLTPTDSPTSTITPTTQTPTDTPTITITPTKETTTDSTTTIITQTTQTIINSSNTTIPPTTQTIINSTNTITPTTQTTTDSPNTIITPTTQTLYTLKQHDTILTFNGTTDNQSNGTLGMDGHTDSTAASKTLDNLGSLLDTIEKSNKTNAGIVMGDVIGVLQIQPKNTETKDINICYSSQQNEINVVETNQNTDFPWSVTIPSEAFDKSRLQNNGSAFVGVLRFTNMGNNVQNENLIVLNSESYGVTMGANISNLTNNIEMIIKQKDLNGKASCRSWDGNGDLSWTTFGCETEMIDNTTIKCSCSHLTFFAVLMSPILSSGSNTTVVQNLETLNLISSIGSGISIFFLSIALFMHFLLRKAKSNQATKILMNMFVSLFVLNLSFLSNESVADSGDETACVFIALVMHYSMLATFTWFFIQALHMYLWLIRKNVSITNYMTKITVFGWVFAAPAVIAIASKNGYSAMTLTSSSGQNSKMCWIIYPLIAYIVNIGFYVFVFIFTSGIFSMIVFKVFQARQLKVSDGKKITFRKLLMMVLSLFLLFGLTWAVAFFSYGPMRIPSYYIFSVLNSLQGFFLFLYYMHIHNDVAGTFSDDPQNSDSMTTIAKSSITAVDNIYN